MLELLTMSLQDKGQTLLLSTLGVAIFKQTLGFIAKLLMSKPCEILVDICIEYLQFTKYSPDHTENDVALHTYSCCSTQFKNALAAIML